MNRITDNRESFAFETTLSGLNFVDRIKKWKKIGYEVILYFLKLPNEDMAIQRVRLRVAEGGHNVPEEVIIRRYHREDGKISKNTIPTLLTIGSFLIILVISLLL